MTRETWKVMTLEKQLRKIAKLCGWTEIYPAGDGVHLKGLPLSGSRVGVYYIPFYLNDLNAMHKAEKVFIVNQREDVYAHWLKEVTTTDAPFNWPWNATAAQRAEAFVLTMDR